MTEATTALPPEPWDAWDTPLPASIDSGPSGGALRGVAQPVFQVEALAYRDFTVDDLRGLTMPTLDFVIDGLFAAGSLNLFSGREKEGKSLALLDAAVAVATGQDWAGRATTPGWVVYCPAEDSLRTVRDRLLRRIGAEAITGELPLSVAPLSGVAVVPGEAAARLDLNDPAMVLRLRELIERRRPVLVILDCLREIHGARENESDDMTATMRPLRQLAHELNVAIIVVHHASKGVTGSSRGSTAIPAACDTTATWTATGGLAADGEDGAVAAGPLRAVLTVKGRDVPLTSIALELGDDLRFRPVTPAARSSEVGPGGTGPDRVPARTRILGALDSDRWQTAAEIVSATGVTEGTTKNILTALLAEYAPPVERTGTGFRGDPFRYRRAGGEPEPQVPRLLPPGVDVRDDANDWWRH